MPDTVKRLNYYDHQFLRVPDFTDEQNYYLSMRRLHNSALHTWGIVQGLGVVALSGGTGTAVNVSAGFALDSAGREMVLAADTKLELGGVTAGTTLYITIAYDEQPSDPPTEGGGSERTRITEAPKLSFSGTAPADASVTLILARVPRVGNGLGTVDGTDRKQAGVALGNDITVATLTLKNNTVPQANWPVLSCSAANQASFANSGLLVNGNVGIGTTTPAVKLEVSGALKFTNSGFNGDDGKIGSGMFAAGLNFVGIKTDQTYRKLSIWGEITQQQNDGTNTWVGTNVFKDNVGIGTATPAVKLEVNGALKFTNSGSDGNDGKIGSGMFGVGLNIVGIKTDQTYRKLSIWGEITQQQNGGANTWVGTNFFKDNVGIGTASPTLGKLQTVGIVGNTAAVFASDGQGIALVASWPNIGFNSYFNAGWKAINTGYGGIIGVDEGAGGLHFRTADTVTGQGTPHVQQERMRIANNGNVGIGTPGPDSRLDIVGGAARTATHPAGLGLYVTADSQADSLGIEFRHTNGSQGIGFGFNTIYATGSNADQALTIQSRGASALTLTANAATITVGGTTGNVGIGTATPVSDLHIRKDAPAKPGPTLTLMNGGGGAGSTAAIDFSGYDPAGQLPAFRIQAIDNGSYSAHLTFSSKDPGANANKLGERVRIAADGVFTANSSVQLGNSDLYFTKTDHAHTGQGNALGRAAIENDGSAYNALMILGRTVTVSPLLRVVKMWDRFEMNGEAFKPGGGAWGTLSDKKLKKNISPLQGVLDKLLSLHGVSFEWKNPQQYGNLGGTQMGLVAQDVVGVFPDWVGRDLDGNLTLSIRGFEALAIEAFREIKQEINVLQDAMTKIRDELGIEAKDQKPVDKATKSAARKAQK
jgi:hypothetical protein